MTLFLSNATGKGTPTEFNNEVSIQSTEDMIAAAKYVHIMCKRAGNSRAEGSAFEWGDCLYADVDGGIPIYEFSNNYSAYEYYLVTSKSHQILKDGKTVDRFHLYFPVDRIEDLEIFEKLMRILSDRDGFDHSIKDYQRQFFGSPAKQVIHNPGLPITELLFRFFSRYSDQITVPQITEGHVPIKEMVEGTGRNDHLFRYGRAILAHNKNLGEFVDIVRSRNNEYKEPMGDEEVNGIITRAYASGLPKEAAKLLAQESSVKGPYLDEKIYTAKEVADVVGEDIINRHKRPIPISTGFKDFDKAMSGGFRPKDFCIVAAFTSDGKSTLLMNFAVSAARTGRRVGILSLEEDILRLGGRITSNLTSINQTQIFNPPNTDSGVSEGIQKGLNSLSGMNIVVNHSPGMFVDDVERMAERMITEHNIEMLVIDYLQMLRIKGDKEIRERVGDIVIRLTSLARFRGIVLITASQLNRAGADNPTLTNLSESSKIEHQADHVFIITAKTEDSGSGPIRTPNAIRLVKNRQGPKNISVIVKLDGNSMTFKPS